MDAMLEPTAEMPLLTERQVRWLEIVKNPLGTVEDLVDEIQRVAQEDIEAYQDPDRDEEATAVVYACEMLLKDYTGSKLSWHIIRGIEWTEILPALIDGTIAYRLFTNPDMNAKVMRIEHVPGIYYNGIRRRSDGKGLTANEWAQVQAKFRRYFAGSGVVVDENSPPKERADAEEAALFDKQYTTETMEECLEACMAGKRRMDCKVGIDIFCAMMDLRIDLELDPTGTTRQIQMPGQVGYSSDLGVRTKSYGVSAGLRGAPKLMQLLMSILSAMGMDIELVTVPISFGTSAEMVALGEVIVTYLGSTLVDWGGVNPKQPGTARTFLLKKEESLSVSRMIVRDYQMVMQNLERSKLVLAERTKTLREFRDYDADEALDYADDGLARAQGLRQREESLRKRARELREGIEENNTKVEEYNKRIEGVVLPALEVQLEFADGLNEWVDANKDLPPREEPMTLDDIFDDVKANLEAEKLANEAKYPWLVGEVELTSGEELKLAELLEVADTLREVEDSESLYYTLPEGLSFDESILDEEVDKGKGIEVGEPQSLRDDDLDNLR